MVLDPVGHSWGRRKRLGGTEEVHPLVLVSPPVRILQAGSFPLTLAENEKLKEEDQAAKTNRLSSQPFLLFYMIFEVSPYL